MKNTRLISLLSAMKETEFHRLRQFLQSPLYNHSQRVLQLFDLLAKEYPLFAEGKIADTTVFKNIFGKKSFSSALLRNLASDLLKLCEQFVVTEKIIEQSSLRNQLLITYFIENKLFASAESLLHDWQQELKTSPHDADYFQSDYKLMHASFSVAFHRHYKGNLHKLYKKKSTEELFEKLQNYYLYEFAAISAEVANSFKAHNQFFDAMHLLRVTDFFLSQNKKIDEAVLLRIQVSRLLLSGDTKLYPQIKKALLKIQHKIQSSDVQNMFVMLYGYAAERAWKGDVFFKNELENLTDLRERLNLLLDESKEINPIAFWNITQSKLSGKGKKAALDFINLYENNLPKNAREETLLLAKASVLFYESKFEEALANILTVGKPFFASEIAYRGLMIKCYYELKHWDMLQNTIETSEKFLKNNRAQLPSQIYSAVKNYLEILRLLSRCQTEPRPQNIQKLKDRFKNNPPSYETVWLKEKSDLFV